MQKYTHFERKEVRVMRFWRKRAHGGGKIVYIVLFRPCHRPKKKKKAARYDTLLRPDGPTEFQMVSASSPSASEPTMRQGVVKRVNFFKATAFREKGWWMKY
jgi:hypothetical protein